MSEEKTVYEEAGHTENVGDNEMHIDDKVLNSPAWVEVSAAAIMIGKGDRQIRNIADKEKWEKRYGRVKGLPRLHYPKSTIEEYIERKGITAVMAPKPAVIANQQSNNTSSQQDEELPNNQKIMSNQLSVILDNHKTVVNENIALQKKNTVIEKQNTFWKTSLFWMIALTILGIGSLSVSWFFSHKELSNKISDLGTELSSKDTELSKTKSSLIQTETELKTIKSMYKVPESQNAVGGDNAITK